MKPSLCLVKPPESSRFNFGTYSLGVLAAAVRDHASITIIDATNLTMYETVEAVKALQPNYIGVTVMGLPSVQTAAQFIARIRNNNITVSNGRSSVTILAGGHGATMAPEPLLIAGADAVVLGEGELTLQHVIENGIHPGVPGLACLVDGNLICGPPQVPIRPLDNLRTTARDIMPLPPDGVHLMETSRGCPHTCTFCETTRFYGQQWRSFSPGRVVAEVRQLVTDYDAWIIHFADDNFAADPRRVIQICDQLKYGPLPAFFMASARADDLLSDCQLIPALAAARILRVSIGVENVEPEMMGLMGKHITFESYKEVFRRLRANGIFTVASFIVGLPGEKHDSRMKAVELAVQVGADSAHFLPFMPFPGIPLAAGSESYAPDPVDIRDAMDFTRIYMDHVEVKKQLEDAASNGDIRGLLARATLQRGRQGEMAYID